MFKVRIICAAVLAAAMLVPAVADAAQLEHRRSPYVGAIAIDASNGRVLCSDAADRECYPASCTKLMTARLLLKAVAEGKIARDARIVQSKRSAREEPSRIGLLPGESMSIDDALKAIMLKSANDISMAIAECVAGSVEAFVERMNEEARLLGMTSTVYASPNGLPPPRGSARGFDKSTAADLAKLGAAIVSEQPQLLEYTSLPYAKVAGSKGVEVAISNHNNLLNKDYRSWRRGVKVQEVDGLKTGYIDAGGSSVVITGERAGKRAIVVVVGSATAQERDENASRLILDALGALAW